MSKESQNVGICYQICDTVCACGDLEQALEVLTDTIAVVIAENITSGNDRALVMGACISRLRRYKKRLRKNEI